MAAAILLWSCTLVTSAAGGGERSSAQPSQPAAPDLTVPATPAPQLTATDLDVFFDGVLRLQLAKSDIAGAVVAVVKNGQLIFAKGYGYADVAKRKLVSPENTLFRVGSISKLFTWTCVMQLVNLLATPPGIPRSPHVRGLQSRLRVSTAV
jgi:CubicO group peptidase (beta-lactamase class C family)